MTREENLHWIDEEIRTWENECQSKHPIKEALYAARRALEQEPCKDAVSVASVFEIMGNLMSIPYDFDRSITEKDVSESMDKIRALPRVTPQEPNTWDLDDAREDFMHDVYNTLDFLPTNEEANRIIDSFDRVTSSIEQDPRKDEVILTKEEYGELVSSEFDNGYAKGYREALEQESTTKNDIRYNRVENELNRVKDELEPTTKNDLEVDAISRQAVQIWRTRND